MSTKRTYSKKPSEQSSKSLDEKIAKLGHDQVKLDDKCFQGHVEDTPHPPGNQVKDADELIGMGAVSMLGDDIQFMLDSIHPKRITSLGSVQQGLKAIRASIMQCAEYGRQFRANNGLSLVFEWWEGCDEKMVQGELLWLFCHLGYKLRRVDHFVSVSWIFKAALNVLDRTLDITGLNSTDAFSKHTEMTKEKVGLFMIGKACFCDSEDTRNDLVLGLTSVLSWLHAKNDQTLAILDIAVSLKVSGVREHIATVLHNAPFNVSELKVLVSVSGSENGWLFISKSTIHHLISNMALNENEWRICAYSILVNCVDRSDKTADHYKCIADQIDTILQLNAQELDEQAKLYSSLLVAFCLQSIPSNSLTLTANQIGGIKAAVIAFSLIPDVSGASNIRRLTDWLTSSGWIPESHSP